MRRPIIVLACLLSAALLSVAHAQKNREGPYAVNRIIDGDTVELLVDGKRQTVRLIGVDTPETVHPTKPVEYFGKEASAFTKRLLDGQRVTLDFDQQRTDRYGRLLAYVYRASDGLFVNHEIIRQGYGHAYALFPFQYMGQFKETEKEAREAGQGLWAAKDARLSEKETVSTSKNSPQETVYVTRTGKKYHVDRCRSLAKSRIPISLKEASNRYGPCSICDPPVLNKSGGGNKGEVKENKKPPSSSGGQCKATTKKGTRCKRKAPAGSNYCWQHGG